MPDQADLRRQATYQLARALLQHEAPALAQALVLSLPSIHAPEDRMGVLQALQELINAEALQAVWESFQKQRHPELKQMLKERGWQVAHPIGLQVLSQLIITGPIRNATAEQVPALLAACDDPDEEVAADARWTLVHLEDPQAQEQVCRWVVEHDHPHARQAALAAGYTPREARLRALFFLVTEQWERYTQLDFDNRILRIFHETASPEQRRRLAEFARQSGWTGYVEALTGDSIPRRLETLVASEWAVLVSLLSRAGRQADAWRLAQAAPAQWSARLLASLAEAGWQPHIPEEQPGFNELVALANACLDTPLPAYLARFVQGLPGHNRPVTAIAFHPQSAWAASSSADHSVRLWRLPEGETLLSLMGHNRSVETLAVHPQGELLASGGADKVIILWKAATGQRLKTFGAHGAEITALAFQPQGEYLASGDLRSVRLWHPASGQLTRLFTGLESQVNRLEFDHSGEMLIASDDSGSLCVWDIHHEQPRYTLMEQINSWSQDPNGEWLVTASPYGRVRVWRLSDGGLEFSLSGHSDSRNVLALRARNDDNTSIFSIASTDYSRLHLWNLPQGEQPLTLESHSQRITCMAAAAHAGLFATGSDDHTVRLWHSPSGIALQNLGPFTGPVKRLAFSPCGNWLVTSDDNNLRLWAVIDAGAILRRPPRALQPADLDQVEVALQGLGSNQGGHSWLTFTRRLVEWRRRFDIELGELSSHLTVGEFDIEIDWTT